MIDPLPPSPAKPTKTHWGQDMTKSLIEPSAKVGQPVPKLCNEAFSKKIYSGLMYIALFPGLGPQRDRGT